MNLTRTAITFTLATLASSAWAGDAAFIEKAAQGGMAEVAAGQLAISKARHADVRQFGSMMVEDHGAAHAKLAALARSEGVKMPESYGQDHADMLQTLRAADGPGFDQAYMSHMVRAHEKTLQLLKSEMNDGSDPDVRAYAAATLPTVEKHLREARRIAGRESAAQP